ncbi:MAG TPA: hypothetical protein PLE40_00385 [Candidatus Pacearchaeota archaeon]|nr:hypothetical protein [Candidatus Pacearchaeota archaeon]
MKFLIESDSYNSKITDDTIYSININNYPPELDVTNSEINFERVLNGYLSIKGNELISSNFSNFENYKSMDFSMKNEDLNIFTKGKIIIVDDTLYQLLAVYKDGKYNENDYNRFINSFQLLK